MMYAVFDYVGVYKEKHTAEIRKWEYTALEADVDNTDTSVMLD